MSKPFLKWAGGKHKLTTTIAQKLPKAERLIEPFAGSAALSLSLEFEAYVWNDVNRDLINLYQTLKQEKEHFIHYAQSFFIEQNNQENRFYELREQFNCTQNQYEKSALFIYLNRHAFNGLCRYNKKGEFNVPFGKYKKPYFPYNEMLGFLSKSDRIELYCNDFEYVLSQIQKNDVVYCDPPYVPLNETSSFTAYTQDGFNWSDQVRLMNKIEAISSNCRGIVLSNHDTEATRFLYRRAEIQTIEVQRNIAAKGESRKKVKELLALWNNHHLRQTLFQAA